MKYFHGINDDNKHSAIIKSWCETPEDGAIEQAKNLARLPFVYKQICLMPDTHLGYGMPIGGVMATQDYVVPNAVGVDIGCVDGETEFLSPTGWIKIKDYNNEQVMQYNPDTNKGTFITPQNYIKAPCEDFIKIKNKYGISQVISPEHRCLVYKYDRSYTFTERDVVSADKILTEHSRLKNGYRHRFLTAFSADINTKVPLSDEQLRVMVMVCADGHIEHNKCILRFKKERKYLRAVNLLSYAHISFSSFVTDDVYTIKFYPPIKQKGIHQFWKANQHQLQIIGEEVLYWDGNIQQECFYTRIKEEADFINYVFSATGHRSTIKVDNRKSGIDYRVFRLSNTKIGINSTPKTKMSRIKINNGFKYCFTVPSSFLVLRRDGNVVITGNCGMCATKTSLNSIDISILKKIMGDIRKLIPVGKNHRDIGAEVSSMPEFPEDICTPVINREFNKALFSVGTLGGGNHFIEIQKGDDGFLWVMIHSGSRNLGKQVADYYNKIAVELNEKYFSSVPKKYELAFLPLDSDIGKSYMAEMQYCVDYALLNRRAMMEIISGIFAEHAGYDFGEVINIAHNYARMENHFGKNVLVHRKGATSARKDEIGIIPGSQGTSSYIVRGLGNPESFESCSHGAGRKMGRKEAQRTLSLEDEQKKLDDRGILHSVRHANDLDEAPGSYKDIDVVMKEQADLVEPIVRLEPLAVVKG